MPIEFPNNFLLPSRSLKTHGNLMSGLDSALDAIALSLPPGSNIVYLDIPVHFNVGDLLINQGTELFFKRMRYIVHGRLTTEDLCDDYVGPTESLGLRPRSIKYLDRMDPSVAFVMHGGGNFGDLYPRHQLMREAIVKRFPDRLIIMLPQTMHFSSEAKANASLDELATHPNLHLYFRDSESLKLARSRGISKIFLAPDMAHALRPFMGAQSRTAGKGSGSICLRRLDEEGTPWIFSGKITTECDWASIIGRSHKAANRVVIEMMRRGLDPSRRIPIWLWYFVTQNIVNDAIQLFLAHDSVITDRLHAVILAALLDRPVAYIDNSYGKLSRYVRAFLSGSPSVYELTPDSNPPGEL